jgi:subtilisin family serine protease
VTGTNTESGAWFEDGDGHGTHTAGTIGAVGNNSIGVGTYAVCCTVVGIKLVLT